MSGSQTKAQLRKSRFYNLRINIKQLHLADIYIDYTDQYDLMIIQINKRERVSKKINKVERKQKI